MRKTGSFRFWARSAEGVGRGKEKTIAFLRRYSIMIYNVPCEQEREEGGKNRVYMQIRLPLACLLITVYCFWYYRRKRRLHTKTAKVFETMTVTAIIHLAAATVTEYTVNNRDVTPPLLNYFFHIVYFISISLCCCLVLYYLLQYIERGGGRRQYSTKVAMFVVGVLTLLAQILLPIEYIDTGHGSYSYGPKAYALYVLVIYVMATLLYELFRYRKILGREQNHVFLASVIVYLIIAAIQIAFPYILLTSLGLTLIVLGFMMNTEDVHLYVAYKTGLFNELGCQEIIRERLLSGKPFQVGMYVFLGNEGDAANAAKAVEAQLPERETGLICGMATENVMLVLPSTNQAKLGEPPAPASEEELLRSGLSYTTEVLSFGPGDSVDKIWDFILQRKEFYEAEALQRDDLTGVMRREAFVRKAEFFISQRQAFSFVMVDMDDLKSVNDTYGHGVGDQALQFLADAIRSTVRSSDLVGRMGGDEFWIALYGTTEKERVREVIGRIQKHLADGEVLPGSDLRIQVSFGVSVYEPENGEVSFQELYASADAAVYHVKRNGKNGISFEGKTAE